ncbi:hypothetical protein ACFL56_00155 [Candidatus Margulisiibacteriota bacterium]
MKSSIKTGLSFGLTSGIITTLGLIVGLHAGTHSKLAVLGGIITIAVADALSDALGIHVSQESHNQYSFKEIWEATFATLISKFIFAITFLIPILLYSFPTAIYISITWGLILLAVASYFIAIKNKDNPIKVIGEHVAIAIIVIILTHYIGEYISKIFT